MASGHVSTVIRENAPLHSKYQPRHFSVIMPFNSVIRSVSMTAIIDEGNAPLPLSPPGDKSICQATGAHDANLDRREFENNNDGIRGRPERVSSLSPICLSQLLFAPA